MCEEPKTLPTREYPVLANIIAGFGVLQIIGGIVLCAKLWPDLPETGYRWLFSAYVPAMTWLATGLISGVLFFAAAAVIIYLVQIRNLGESLGLSLFRLELPLRRSQEELPQEEKKG